jgi:hypothetical protein
VVSCRTWVSAGSASAVDEMQIASCRVQSVSAAGVVHLLHNGERANPTLVSLVPTLHSWKKSLVKKRSDGPLSPP